MPTFKVTFDPANITVDVDPTKCPHSGHGEPGSILDIALANNVHIEHACGGVGVCGTCHVIVRQGMQNLSPAADDELDTVDQAPNCTPESRLACQAVVKGDVTVHIPNWNRNTVSEK